ncbi:MAG TPA: hypothetical protein VHA13_05480 [Gammaproteobacteria bacterium]|nr:hypothetical protein [Gammaproteobacteria bacterium]
MDERKEFLLHLFDKAWDDIGSTIKVIWQSIVILLGAIATIIFTKAKVIPITTTYTIAIIAIVWMLAHIENAAYWFNRNLAIIANIERQFLNEDDSENIHFYFTAHRPAKMAPHFQLQYWFLITIAICLISYYSKVKLPPFFKHFSSSSYCNYIFSSIDFPYLTAILGTICLYYFRNKNINKYNEFKKLSPGKEINKKIAYKHGHGGENLS